MKKGFTLVELLTVISLLALIGLITIPIISTTLKNSRKNAFKQTLNGIIDSAKIYNAENNYKGINEDGVDVTSALIQFENKDKIISGKVLYSERNYYLEEVMNDSFCASGYLDNYNIYQGACGTGKQLENNYN